MVRVRLDRSHAWSIMPLEGYAESYIDMSRVDDKAFCVPIEATCLLDPWMPFDLLTEQIVSSGSMDHIGIGPTSMCLLKEWMPLLGTHNAPD